jgi:hypothetical protein
MPIIYKIQYEDGTTEIVRIPAEIWRKGETSVTKVIRTSKAIDKIVLDPFLETADIDRDNNQYPRETQLSKFEAFKRSPQRSQENPMQKNA